MASTDNSSVEIQEYDIPGLYYVGCIHEDTATTIAELDMCEWSPVTNHVNSRLVQHYGFRYDYVSSKVREAGPTLPPFLEKYQTLLTNICKELNIIDAAYTFNQCIVNNYLQGQGISAHIDVKQYGGVIGCFTLGTGATMIFEHGNEKREIYVEADSLYIMSGEARYVWKHSMPARKSDTVDGKRVERGRRVSITFRCVPL
jgi:alkylated DNA repair dioxygenase AlkB